jgi:polysaccharide pyruvyl transferase WcaK-like protein
MESAKLGLQAASESSAIAGPRDKSLRGRCPRLALLTPYSGGNLGDAAIQDALIANMRLRLPGAHISGISLDSENFVQRHGQDAFPLCANDRAFYSMSRKDHEGLSGATPNPLASDGRSIGVKSAIARIPLFGGHLKEIYRGAKRIEAEVRHFVQGYRFLLNKDLLIVAGGGQLDEEWGGPWGHPFSLFKWALVAWAARVPYVMASVGACKVQSGLSRFFLSKALSMAEYRSYRDKHSRTIAAEMHPLAAKDTVVPDLAFSLPPPELPASVGIGSISEGLTVVAISPIVFAKPERWPSPDRVVYDRYLQQMVQLVSQLLNSGYFLIIVWSSHADQSVIPELLDRLDPQSRKRLARQMLLPALATWKDLVAILLQADCVVASRLHSAILSFIARKPTVAISFDPKVDRVMQDVGQCDYLLQIRDFTAGDIVETLDRMQVRKDSVRRQIDAYLQETSSISARQYDALAEFAVVSQRRRN